MKFQAIAIDLRQLADEIFENNTLTIFLPYPVYLSQKDHMFIERHIKRRMMDGQKPGTTMTLEGIYDPN
jgi:hypothetical protein